MSNNNNMTTLSGTGVETTGNVGNYSENEDDLKSINDAARYADISYQWAVSEELVDDGTNVPDNSSKYYAAISKDLADEIGDVKEDADRAEAWGQLAVASAISADEDATQTALDVIDTTEDAVSTGEDATSAEEDALRAELAADRAEAAGAGSTGVIGEMKWFPTDHTNPTIRSGYVMPLGQELLRAGEYAALWAEVLQGRLPSVTELEWQAGQSGVYSDGDGATTFRMPNMAGQFLRIAGAADPDFITRLIGEIQVDEVGGHEHVTTNTLAAASTFTGTTGTATGTSTFTGSAMAAHVHANTATGAAHTHTGPSHGHSATFSGSALPSHTHSLNDNSMSDSGPTTSAAGNGSGGYATGGTSAGTPSGSVTVNSGGTGATGGASATSVSMTNVSVTAGTPTGTVATSVTDVISSGTVGTTLSGDVIVAPSTGAETRPTNVYIQPYIVYAAAQEVAGLNIRGIWDVPNNTLVGDTLNSSIVKGVAPVAPDGGFTNGIAYRVVVGGDFDLNGDPTLESINVGDYVVWFGTDWIQLSAQPVTSVNTFTGDVVIHGENANIDDVSPTTIKAYIDAAIAGISTEGIKVGGLYLSMNATTPDVDLGYGTWALLTGAATLSLGSGIAQPGTVVGSNTQVPTLLAHSHISPAHTHANTATGAAHTHTGAAHGHTASFAGSAHKHLEGAGAPSDSGDWGEYNTVDRGASVAAYAAGNNTVRANNTQSVTAGGTVTVNSGGDGPTGAASATGVTMTNAVGTAAINNSGDSAAMNIQSAQLLVNVYKRLT